MKYRLILFVFAPILWAMQCSKQLVEPNPPCPAQVIISASSFRNAPSDDLTITKAAIINDCLLIEFTAGGCDGSSWEVNLYDANAIKESFPVQRDLRLSLNNMEECKALISQSVTFDLRPIQLEYDEILLNLEPWGDQLLYEY